MEFMERRILQEGEVREGNVLKVGSFLNHQLDIGLLEEVGEAFYEKYRGAGITKVLTIEASGIAIACLTAQKFGVPVVFAKKSKSRNLDDDVYTAEVYSYTHQTTNRVTLSKRFLTSADNVLIVDDFLANGRAMEGLLDVCSQAGASVAGIGICIEKGFQPGGAKLRSKGYNVTSLAIVESMENGNIVFRK